MAGRRPTTVARRVAELLQRRRPLSYEQIAAKVREERPGSRTTARSVASVASALRAGGAELPDRRTAGNQTPSA